MQYRSNCQPISAVSAPASILPQFNAPAQRISPNSHQNPSQPQNQHVGLHPTDQRHQGGGNGNTQLPPLNGTTRPPVSEIYWCVDRPWLEPSETRLCIQDARTLSDDGEFCGLLNEQYGQVRGFRGRFLSWKRCLGVRFISFRRIFPNQNQVACMLVGLPKLPGTYEYSLLHPEAVHMAIASQQIIAGMYNPAKLWGNTTIAMIPKKTDSTLASDVGTEGWGLYAVQGWSLWKIVLWICACNFIGMVFVVLWLVLVDKTDLQNAFVPATFLVTMLCLAIGIPQYLDAA
ncbi:hypothetical protein VTN77DRAFT_935 [Rasamsonia byssochlamydoides]|uniref:uncharacterized protein n=1 Tax=Rasamsonia byssochlamydoides TaxID=89139 RepID=UPI003742D0E1